MFGNKLIFWLEMFSHILICIFLPSLGWKTEFHTLGSKCWRKDLMAVSTVMFH